MHSRILVVRKTSWLLRHRLRGFSNKCEASRDNQKKMRGTSFPNPSLLMLASAGGVGLCFWLSSDGNGIAFADTHPPAKDNQPVFLFGDEYRKRVFFNYEWRIRMRSTPEKVFEYFASVEAPNGEVLMTPADLMRAVVPVYPPSESDFVRGGRLRGERPPGELQCPPSDFFMLFDTNSDGLISFPEYLFLVTLLSIPEANFAVAFKMFDIDNSGEIEREEFKKVMALMRTYNRHGGQHIDGIRKGFKFSGSVENGGLIESFFGKDGNYSLKHETFVQFLRDLRDEIVRLEFAHYDFKRRGSIPAKDFALSMVASADMSHTSKLLDRVDDLSRDPDLSSVRISYQEFRSLAELRRSVQLLSLALFSHGAANGILTKPDFQRAASHVCGIELTKNVIDIIFHVFDTNKDGHMGSEEFVRVMQRREKELRVTTKAASLKGLMSCCWDCVSNE
ncbi:hypothetical protein V2J09_017964 [Rumex salicifolius]